VRGGDAQIALVLAGGAAHGAYEVGVLDYIVRDVARALGRAPRFEIICGTSVGAINACALAAQADDPRAATSALMSTWRSLRLDTFLRPDLGGMLAMLSAMLLPRRRRGRGALIDARPLIELVESRVPFWRISHNLRAGHLSALAVSATHVASGRTVVFIEQRAPRREPSPRPRAETRHTRIRAPHALASSAVPLLFPGVEIDGELYCDGGLRQMLPLSPALHLGADGLLVVNPRHPAETDEPAVQRARERAYDSPVYLVGRTLDVLLVDRVREDLDRLQHVNALLAAGERRFGPAFVRELGESLAAAGGAAVRPRATVEVRTSLDVGRLAAEHVRSPRFPRLAGRLHARLFRWLADAEGTPDATFLSYLLFDGAFADTLIELGRDDARASHEALCAMFEPGRDAERLRGA
jgi:NTE family protein